MKAGLLAFGLLASAVLLVASGIALSVARQSEKRETRPADRPSNDDRIAELQKKLDEQRAELQRERSRHETAIRDLESRLRSQSERKADPPLSVQFVVPPAAPPPSAPSPDEAANKRLRGDYEARMDAARASMVMERYADALAQYQSALRLYPNDVAAARGVRDAEDRLQTVQDRSNRRASAAAALIDKARSALKSKHYDEALAAANEALSVAPGDTEAKQIQRDAATARRNAKAAVADIVSQADVARASGRYEEASSLYSQALQMSPADTAALQGKQLADQAALGIQAGLTAYYRYMAVGTLAMQNLQFVDAAAAFTEALRLVPGDLAAARGLRDAQVAVNGVVAGQANFYRQLQAGYAALQSQNPAAASTAFQAALRLSPNNPLASVGLQQAQMMKK
jgi:tetratricopeptide (TPR) repeat protein